MAAIFERMRGLQDALRLLAKIDLDDISKVLAFLQVIQDEKAPVKERVLAVLGAADLLVDYTETPTDDLVVEWVTNLAKEDSFWQVVAMVTDLLDGGAVAPMALQGEGLPIGADGSKGMIPWALVIQMAQIIATIISSLSKK